MKLVIDIPEEQFKTVNFIAHNAQHWRDKLTLEQIIATGERLETGQWIDREVYDDYRWKCPKCGRTVPYQENYCPDCGLPMVKNESEVEE